MVGRRDGHVHRAFVLCDSSHTRRAQRLPLLFPFCLSLLLREIFRGFPVLLFEVFPQLPCQLLDIRPVHRQKSLVPHVLPNFELLPPHTRLLSVVGSLCTRLPGC